MPKILVTLVCTCSSMYIGLITGGDNSQIKRTEREREEAVICTNLSPACKESVSCGRWVISGSAYSNGIIHVPVLCT